MRGDADLVLAGGTEGCIHPLILARLLLDARARAGKRRPDGGARVRSRPTATGS